VLDVAGFAAVAGSSPATQVGGSLIGWFAPTPPTDLRPELGSDLFHADGDRDLTAPYASHFSTRQTPQRQPIPGSSQVPNNAGGYGFAVDDWVRLDRFLVLGAESGSYYVSEHDLTIDNARAVQRCIGRDGVRTVQRIVEISEAGRAPKNDPAIFALALAASQGSAETRAAALAALPRVCRIGTHLFQFAEDVQAFRGWGRALRRAIGAWYTARDPRELAYQLTKYQQRNGWSHRDLLRLTHPKVEKDTPTQRALAWAAGKLDVTGTTAGGPLAPIHAFEEVKRATTRSDVVRLIREHGLVRECIPTCWLDEVEVWDALLDRMPLTALVRNLATMTRLGLLTPGSAATSKVVAVLSDSEPIRKARLHPIALLMALRTYAAGRGERGRHTWTPVSEIVAALDGGFYTAFGNVRPTGKRWLLGLDVSGSMAAPIAGTSLSCCEGATALALVTAHVEGESTICAFADSLRPLPISRRSRLDDALRHTRNVNFGGTDCSLPMRYALQQGLRVDAFVVLTDSETWAGPIHPVQALRQYRDRVGIPASLIVVGMVSSGFSIADPADRQMLDVVGFTSNVPAVMADFVCN
jgi:60 kDa SS-A/Ro ribonucleoprotein